MTANVPPKNAGGITFLNFPNLGRIHFLAHAVTTRFRSDGREFDLALHVAANADDALRNRAALCEALGFPKDKLTCCEQVHGARVAVVDASTAGRGAFRRDDALQGFDAMVTGVPGALLAVFAADCPLTLIADARRRAIAVCHCGWRGLAAGVIANTIAAMTREFGSSPHDLLAGTAPSIEKSCYEIGGEVAEHFALRHADCLMPLKGGKHLLDLRGVVRAQLIAQGLAPENVEQSPLCTKCRADMFFSYRRDGEKAGRFALVAGIKKHGRS
jgi:hypothetical protein